MIVPALDTVKRLVCHAFGCRIGDHSVCERCGSALYYGDITPGRLEPLLRAYRRLAARLKVKRCQQCHARISRFGKEDFCSDKCFEEWIPF